jgi:hypothetical protein
MKIFIRINNLETIIKRLEKIDKEMMKRADIKHLKCYLLLTKLIIDLKGKEKNIKVEKKHNNTFCKERCIKCNGFFDADLNYIYDTKFGYLCYDCVEKSG